MGLIYRYLKIVLNVNMWWCIADSNRVPDSIHSNESLSTSQTVATRRRQQYVTGVLAWALSAMIALALLGSLSFELYFVVTLIGFLVVTELTAPFNLTPQWRSRLKWFILVGLIIFAYIVVRRILAILPEGVI